MLEYPKKIENASVNALRYLKCTYIFKAREIEDYWLAEYPEIDTISNKLKVIEENGFAPIAHFILPQYCWIDNYYKPIEKRFDHYLEKYKNSDIIKQLVDEHKKEIAMYNKFKKYFSYGFYIAQKL